MKVWCISLIFYFGNDSAEVKIDTILPSSNSILFKSAEVPNINSNQLKYHYRQGFFCDFEDKINKGKKMRLNLGVGEN